MTIPPLPNDLRTRLNTLADKAGKSVEDCMIQAVQEYVENWEEYHRTVETLSKDKARLVLEGLSDDEARLVLKAVND